MSIEPLRAKLMSVSMSPDTFKEVMALVMNLEAAAYARGAREAMPAYVNEYPNTRPNIEARIGDPAPNAGDESVGVIYEVLDSKLPESFIRCGFVNGMQRGSFQGRSYEYLSADGVNPARWVLVEKESV